MAKGLSAQTETRDMIIERRELMFAMLGSYWPLLNIANNKSTDLNKAGSAAKTISDAMKRSLQLFPTGTSRDEAEGTWSRAKPEIWSKYSEFEEAAKKLVVESEKLAAVAKEGNLDKFKEQFQLVEQACTACHGLKPTSGGKFRFEK